MKASELIGKPDITPVKVNDLVIPEFGERFHKVPGHKFPQKSLLIKSAQNYGNGSVYVCYYARGQLHSAYLPKDLKLSPLEGTIKDKLVDAYNNLVLKNLGYELSHNMSLGSDPEIFVMDNITKKVIPAFDFLSSKQEKKHRGIERRLNGIEYGSKPIYWDGFQAEFETAEASCLAWQCDSVQSGLAGLYAYAKKHNKNAVLTTRTVMDIDPELLKTSKNEHVEFGCMPSFNAYNMKGLSIPGREVPFRPAGGHIHYGVQNTDMEQMRRIVKALDAILGVACVSLFASFDDPRRRTMYGLAGEYRLPPHGLEYRVLSNAWLIHPFIMNVVFDLSRKAFMMGKKNFMSHWKTTEAETISCINTCDVDKAREILVRNEHLMNKLFQACYGRPENDLLFKMFMNGVESVIDDPENIVGNWNLDKNWVTHCDGQGKNFKMAYPRLVKGYKLK